MHNVDSSVRPFTTVDWLRLCQAPGQKAQPLAGCYEVTSLPSNPREKNIAVIPKQIELRNEPRWNAFALQRVSREGDSNNFENSWTWKPQGIEKVAVNFSNGLGGLRGTLKKSKNGDLTGKLKEWCDFRCAYKRWIGTVRLRKISCQ